jgi:ABC-type multidrug transport system ATPase subunit
MRESDLKSLMRLFAIVSQVHSIAELSIAKAVVENYLKLVVRQDMVRKHLIMYDFYHNSMREREEKTGEKQLSLFSVKAVIICEQANEHLTKRQKIFLLTHILEILSATHSDSLEDVDFIKTIASALKIDDNLFNDCLAFVLGRFDEIFHQKNVLFVSNVPPDKSYKYIYKEFIEGQIIFLHIEAINICLFKHVKHNDQLYLIDHPIRPNSTYTFEKGAVIKSPLLGALFFNDIIKYFLHDKSSEKVLFTAKEVAYNFPDGTEGIASFSLSEESGQFVGIMGGSGVGKSTLLNILNGSLIPTKGTILLNGYDIHKNKKQIEGLIGYVPQDDLLIEELTVFQNLYFNARLCFKDFSKERIILKVHKLLYSLNLHTIKDLRVGSPLNKLISGGQRKRLNIALELIREPYILFVDEPTSGLSSNDSDKVIDLLKHQSLKGKLVVVNIHQPSNDVFKQFDKLIVIDTGGRFVYHGNPHNSMVYFKKYNQLVNAEEGECPTCGNINPDQILQILEARRVNEFGELTKKRLVDSKEWYENYIDQQQQNIWYSTEIKMNLPKIDFSIPSRFEQFKIFNIRNILTKLSDRQFLMINLLEAPILAFILSWFTRYNAGTNANPQEYVFSGNINVPVYIFMGVVVAVFLGLMLSAEDIIRDRKILKREAFLNLNRFSYFNSKIFFLGIILALQVFLFVFVGNSLLQIEGMLFQFWLVLWISSMVAGLLGLNVSSTLTSVVSIYILIPVLLVPQILLGGAMIRFDKLNQALSNSNYVPLVGDIMPSRWAYESLMVYQFSKNKYQRNLIEFDEAVSSASYGLNYYIPALQNTMTDIRRSAIDAKQKLLLDNKIELLNNEINKLKEHVPECFGNMHSINSEQFNVSMFSLVERSLNCTRDYFIKALSESISAKDEQLYALENALGGREQLLALKNKHYNESVADLVLNKKERDKLVVADNRIIRKAEPIYHYPPNKIGRAHLFAPAKRIGDYYIETYWFNVLFLVLMSCVLYILLVFQVFPLVYQRINRNSMESFLAGAMKSIANIAKPILKK